MLGSAFYSVIAAVRFYILTIILILELEQTPSFDNLPDRFHVTSLTLTFHYKMYKVAEFHPVRPQKVTMAQEKEPVMKFPKITICSPAFFSKQRYRLKDLKVSYIPHD